MTSKSGKRMVNLLIKIAVKEYKRDEFLESIRAYLETIRQQPGCLSCDLYQDSEDDKIYQLLSAWKTRKTLEKHFQSAEYELLLGAARVLGEGFEIETAEVAGSGNFAWAQDQIKTRKGHDFRNGIYS